MTREEFLRELRVALQGRIPQGQVNEQLHYYENYIIEESRKGRTEEEVLFSLGNPRLIAKTIKGAFGDSIYYEGHTEKEKKQKKKKFRIRSWYGRLLAGIVLFGFIVILFKIGILLLPVLAVLFMLGSIVRVFYMIFFGNKK